MVRATAQDTLNALLNAEVDCLCGAKLYEQSPEWVHTRAGHVTLKMPKLRSLFLDNGIIERYKRRKKLAPRRFRKKYSAVQSLRLFVKSRCGI